ncbi:MULTISPECIES: phage tail protein [Gammaproteobacteria]|uniref:phage tail protein n=1 Tax=Gammaproteobacteria TaxID=1236 RepID=UPI000DCF6467|nr:MULTISPECIES: tail fiber protein [Gammaproteobacteria]RTE86079.1 hypothetical protein DQX04_05775 [Aliidiomarina sp. B3213]TCZ91433.1 hypothetical protein EYQ95_05785 [Lysobacter sp. N42]
MENYIGEIKLFPYSFIPKGWLKCNGDFLHKNEFPKLHSVIGDQFGYDSARFALPNLNGRCIIGASKPEENGLSQGTSRVTLNSSQLPTHNHYAQAAAEEADTPIPQEGSLWAESSGPNAGIYAEATPDIALNEAALEQTGGNESHENIQPSLGLVYCIAFDGTLPPRIRS